MQMLIYGKIDIYLDVGKNVAWYLRLGIYWHFLYEDKLSYF